MNIHDHLKSGSQRDPRVSGYNHPSQQQGWKDNSYHPSRTLEEANYLDDATYNDRLGVHNPLWRYIITTYTTESDAPLLVIGYEALPLAIELSEWTYPVNVIVKNEEERNRAKRDAERQAGFFKKIFLDGEGFPLSRIAIFIGIMDHWNDNDAKSYVNHLLEGVNEVVCAVRPNRDWRSLFGKNIENVLRYNRGQWMLLRIKKNA